jgi:hypothetical protein
MSKAFIGTLVLAGTLTTSPAAAQIAGAVAAQCAQMKDPVGCTCALATGGTVSGSTWARGRGTDRQDYETCLRERGSAPVRPQQIPGRL